MSSKVAMRHHRLFFRSRVARKARHCRPGLEGLENRQLLSTQDVSWTGKTSDSWDIATNWSPETVPVAGDDVTIDVPGTTVTISSTVESVNSITTADSDSLVISGGGLTVAANSTISGGLAMTGGTLTADGLNTTLSVTGATTASGANLYAEGGATLNVSELTSYQGSGTLEASGAGSTLDLTNLIDFVNNPLDAVVEADGSGTVNLTGLESLSAYVILRSRGQGSLLNVPLLESFSVGSGSSVGVSDLIATDDGQIDSPDLKSINGVTLTLSDTASISLGKITNIDDSSVIVQAGAVLSLPGVTSYSAPGFMSLEATGTGSVLDLPKLAAISNPGFVEDTIEALNDGTLVLSGLINLSANVNLEAMGQGSELNIPNLVTFQGVPGFAVGENEITSEGGGQINPGNLSTLEGMNLTIDSASSFPSDQITSFTNGTLNVAGGVPGFADLSDIAGSNITVSNGAKLSLSLITGYAGSGTTLEATGAGSVLDLSKLTSITGTNTTLEAAGTGSSVNIPNLTPPSGTTITVGDGDSVGLAFGVVALPSAQASATITVPQVPEGVTVNLVSTGTFTDPTINVAQGDAVVLSSGTYVGGVFNVGQGATLSLSNGGNIIYSGTFKGSGAGTVALSEGSIAMGLGGATFDFAGGFFQWSGGEIIGTGGNLTNLGTLNLTGSNEKLLLDVTLDNFGTVTQTGTGNLQLQSNHQPNAIFMIEPGASYLLESDSGVDNYVYGTGGAQLDNAGTIEKTGGSGTSALAVGGSLSNTGTIQADFGILYLDPTSLSQLSGDTLTAGTWNAIDGATLEFPSGTSISGNGADITLGGGGSSISGLSGLSSISGSLSLADGASFSTVGDLSNSGAVTLGAGSTLTVNGNYTQSASASLTVGIGGVASGNDFGQLAVTGSAVLGGSVSASTASGFTPTLGETFPIVTYASETGGASLSFGGVNSGALSVFQPVVGPTNIVLSTVTSPANLVVQPFSVAANSVAGQNLTVTYQVDNESQNAANETWTDSIYLSTQTTLNSSSVLLKRVQQSGVAANGQYSQTVTAPVLGLVPDDYYVVVLADSQGLVPELNRTSTELASTDPVQVTLPTFAPGSPISGTIASGQGLYYQLTLQAGQDVAISANFAALQGGELYVGYQGIPSTSTNLASSTSPTQTTQRVVIPDTQAGTYDILVQGDTGSGTGAPFTLSAQTLPLQVTSISPPQAGTSGTTTLTIQGAEFTAGATVSLVPHGGGSSIVASAVTFQGSTTLFAQFGLASATAGSYDVVVTDNTQKATEPSAFTVKNNASPGHITYNLSVPSVSRPGRIAYLTLTYTNDGGSDAPAPLFVVSNTSDNALLGLPGTTSLTESSVQVLGIETTGPAGTLPPGYQGTLNIPYESTTFAGHVPIIFSLQVMTGDSTAMNWSSLESSLQPSYIPNAAWPAVFANLTAELGSTTQSYLTYLDSEATYLSQLGEYTDDVQRLFGFAINTANNAGTTGAIDSVTDASFPVPGAIPLDFVRQFNASISGRDTMGPFGYGWTDNWQISASADSAGNVTLSDDGSLLYFAVNSNGSYTPAPGEYGTLTLTNGAYQYAGTDGTIIAFNTNGSLDYEEDTDGNRVTAGYKASGDLTSLTASNGSEITIAYNTQGLISSITEPDNQTTTYTYDSGGEHLLTFTDEFGPTTYAYASGPTAADVNALTSITFADGTGSEWSYDAEGRIATTGRLDGSGPEAEVETYAYPAPGEFTITNADGDTTTTFNDDQGNVGETIDALGNITRYSYDSNDNLTEVVAPDGTTTTFSYDANGKMTSETNALGYTISFTYNTFAEPLTFVNQEGYVTSYEYDQYGNLLEQTNPDGTTQQYVYNSNGEVTSSTEPDGQTITYAYNTNAQLAAENLPDGTSDAYTYNAAGDMLTADGSGGDWSFTYNSQNLPTTIVEPYGTLTVQYGVDGNVAQIVDQTGFTANYEYDAVGRLSEITNASGNLIESYSYDAAGNLLSETKGNGTSTDYQYDADGDITQITNLASGGAINSQMTYAYSAVGEVTSMTSGGATTAYEYDADGELVSASSPGDTILYAYDPDGNRTSVTDNGVVTDYVSNDVNEYTSTTTNGVTTTYQYDANGNLIAATTNGQTTSHTFNALNQLTGVSGPNGTFSYVYDPLGYQISSTINGQTTNNLIDPFGLGNVAAQFDSSGDVVAQYAYGLGLVSQVSASGAAYYYDYNLQGSTVGITNSAGVYVNQYSYDPFGQVTTISAGIANPFTFVGQDGVSSDGNGLVYMRNRYYDPSTGQFVSEDPLGLLGGDANARRYVGNAPVTFVDPSGLDWLSDWQKWVQCQLQKLQKWIGEPQNWPDIWLKITDADKYLAPILNWALEFDFHTELNAILKGLNDAATQVILLNGNSTSGAPNQASKDDPDNGDCNCGPPPPPPPAAPPPCIGCGSGGGGYSGNETPDDPNDLIGPSGYGAAAFLTPGGALPYTIEFSNEKTAPVPADNVVVAEHLSPNLNWSTFQLGTIGFGGYVVNVPQGLTSYSTRVNAVATLGVYVDIDASLNLSTGLLTVTFTSLDPDTLDTPSNPLVGFLPADTDPPNGEGYINYTIQPKTDLATGATSAPRRASSSTPTLRSPRRRSSTRSTPARRPAPSPRSRQTRRRPASPSPGPAATEPARALPITTSTSRTTAMPTHSGNPTQRRPRRRTPARSARPIASTASRPIPSALSSPRRPLRKRRPP